jgi:hypothetical protein
VSETYIPAELRRLVIDRAHGRCEYCRVEEAATYLGCEVDHIISEKHGGLTHEANLALACVTCNRAKGSDIATRGDDGTVVTLFHPRQHRWADHFAVEGILIVGQTAIGRATVRLLKLNAPARLAEREALRSAP